MQRGSLVWYIKNPFDVHRLCALILFNPRQHDIEKVFSRKCPPPDDMFSLIRQVSSEWKSVCFGDDIFKILIHSFYSFQKFFLTEKNAIYLKR